MLGSDKSCEDPRAMAEKEKRSTQCHYESKPRY
jgi:hypothetical protein